MLADAYLSLSIFFSKACLNVLADQYSSELYHIVTALFFKVSEIIMASKGKHDMNHKYGKFDSLDKIIN